MAALVASALGFNANAQNFTGETGKYYLQNVESGLYWGVGNSWGTQASLIKNPEYVTLIKNDDGTYNMDTQVSNSIGKNPDNAHYFNGDFMDNASPVKLTIAKSGENYTIANNTNYFGYDATTTVLGKNLESTSPNALWKVSSEEEMIASLNNATPKNPVDATFLLLDPNFNRNSRTVSAWTISEDCKNKNLGGGGDGNHPNACAESYHSVFTISQTITSAPKGLYKLTAQGFYRQDGINDYDLPKFFITTNGGTSETTFPVKTGEENNMGDAGNSFMNGNYAIDAMYIELSADGNITVGTKLTRNTALWCIWDNFTLTYYGNASIGEVEPTYVTNKKQSFNDLVEEANNLYDEPMNGDVLKALKEAASTNVSSYTQAVEIGTAIANLEAAIANAKHSMTLYKATRNTLDEYAEKAKALDGNGQAEYEYYVAEIEAAYTDRTMVEDRSSEISPIFVAAIKAQTTDNADFTGAIINNSFETGDLTGWEIPGESDDTVVCTPDGNHATTGADGKYIFNTWWQGIPITQTIQGLPNGKYRLNVLLASTDDNHDTAYLFLLANGHGDATAITKPKEEFQEASRDFMVTDGTATIGVIGGDDDGQWVEGGHWWYKADNFRLTLLELTPATDNVTITDAEYTAYVTKFNVDFTDTDVKAYKVTSADAKNGATLEEIDAAPKGTAVILSGEAKDYTLTQTKDVVAKITDNLFLPGDGKVAGNGSIYALGGTSKDDAGFYLVKDDVVVPTNKGYLEIVGGLAKAFIPLGGEGEATGIEAVEAQGNEETVIYNLAGQRVANPTNGIYIVNGKKVLINK